MKIKKMLYGLEEYNLKSFNFIGTVLKAGNGLQTKFIILFHRMFNN